MISSGLPLRCFRIRLYNILPSAMLERLQSSMNPSAGSLRAFALAALALAFLTWGANAAQPLIDRGDTTYDPNTSLEWLDLRFTQGQSYASILGGWGDFTTSGGYRFATAEEIKQLFLNAGAKSLGSPNNPPVSVNVEAAKLVLSLLGTTLPMAHSDRSWMFYDPSSDNPPTSIHVPTAVFGEGIIGGGYPDREGFFYVPGLYPLTTSSSPEWASALVRVAPKPVPSTLLYANDFEAGPASLDGLEKVLNPTRGEVSVTVEAGQLKVAIAEAGYAGVSRDLRIGNPLFKPRLPANRGMLTWSFNISNEDGRFNNNFDFVLASSHADPFDIAAHGYALRGGNGRQSHGPLALLSWAGWRRWRSHRHPEWPWATSAEGLFSGDFRTGNKALVSLWGNRSQLH